MDHPLEVGKLDLRAMLTVVPELEIARPVYLEKDFELDDGGSIGLKIN